MNRRTFIKGITGAAAAVAAGVGIKPHAKASAASANTAEPGGVHLHDEHGLYVKSFDTLGEALDFERVTFRPVSLSHSTAEVSCRVRGADGVWREVTL